MICKNENVYNIAIAVKNMKRKFLKYILLLIGSVVFLQMYGQSYTTTIRVEGSCWLTGADDPYTLSSDRKTMVTTTYLSSCKECEQKRATLPATYTERTGSNCVWHYTYTFFCCDPNGTESLFNEGVNLNNTEINLSNIGQGQSFYQTNNPMQNNKNWENEERLRMYLHNSNEVFKGNFITAKTLPSYFRKLYST